MKKSGTPKKDKRVEDDKEYEKPMVAKTAYDLQRIKLMKLMKNPDKPIVLPDRPKSKNSPSVPEFVRNVMGSSAGAGSGEFHVYRHLRRKEYSRQKFIQEKGRKETLDEEYHRKIENNKEQAELTTMKKRAKRLKKKQRQKQAKKLKSAKSNEQKTGESDNDDRSDDDSSDDEKSEKTGESVDGSVEKVNGRRDSGHEEPDKDVQGKNEVNDDSEKSLENTSCDQSERLKESKNSDCNRARDDSSEIVNDESRVTDTNLKENDTSAKKIVPDDNVKRVDESENSSSPEIKKIEDSQSP